MRAAKPGGAVLAGVAAMLGGVLLLGAARGSGRQTYAEYSDFADVHASAAAGVWTPDPPTECGDLSKYAAIVYGTDGDDVIDGHVGAFEVVDLKHGGNREIVMGLGGNDDLRAGNGNDCIVGGAGDDVIRGGNGKDILLGGGANDRLLGSNASDLLDGGPGTDACIGGAAPGVQVNCEQPASTDSVSS